MQQSDALENLLQKLEISQLGNRLAGFACFLHIFTEEVSRLYSNPHPVVYDDQVFLLSVHFDPSFTLRFTSRFLVSWVCFVEILTQLVTITKAVSSQ